MAINREVKIEFDGEEYRFTPSNKLLRRIDAELHPQTIFGIMNQLDGQQAPLPALALIISELLKSGGWEGDEDDVLAELYNDVLHNNGNGIRPLVESIAECLTVPGMENEPGNSPPRGTGGKRKKSKAKEEAKE